MVVLLVVLTVAIVISAQLLFERFGGRTASSLSPAASADPLSSHAFVHGGHTWARLDTSGEAKVGIDAFLLRILGGVDAVSLPEPGRVVRQGEKVFSVTRAGKVLSLAAPIEGVVASVNRGAEASGWLFTIRPRNLSQSLRNLKALDSASAWIDAESRRFASFLVAGSPRLAEVGATLQDGGQYPAGVIEKLSDEQLKAFEQDFLS
jgi:glycine cleavage system H lipoate-binding protein